MTIDKEQFEDLLTRTLRRLGLHSPAAVALLLGTAAQESRFGTYIRQLGSGPARGVFQMEPATEQDIWINYLVYRPQLVDKIKKICNITRPDTEALEANLLYQICMARIHYLRVPSPLPASDDLSGLADYWKRFYNTSLGAGTVAEFADNWRRYVVPV